MEAYMAAGSLFILGIILGAVLIELMAGSELKRARAENAKLRSLIAPMDRDGDGRPGGSLKR